MSERHHYTDFQIIFSHPAVSKEEKKDLEKQLEDSDSEVRRDIRRLFEASNPGEHTLFILMPSARRRTLGLETPGCQISFKKVR